ncbi:MAG: nuclear transport factor 2 family protein [Bacteroidales bacterium]
MKTSMKMAVLAMVTLIATAGAFAQEWTKAQKEVWQVCETAWKDYQNQNWDGVAAYMHPNYQGWDDQSPLPYSKEKAMQMIKERFTTVKLTSYDIEPARIVVLKDAALIDYYYSYTIVSMQGDKKEFKELKGMFVEFYVKEGGKWLCLGDMTTHL